MTIEEKVGQMLHPDILMQADGGLPEAVRKQLEDVPFDIENPHHSGERRVVRG